MKKIGVTGASGHIGGVLLPMLQEKGYDISILQFREQKSYKDVTVFSGSILDNSALDKFVEGQDVIIHMAASIDVDSGSKSTMNETNIQGTQNVLNVCKKHNVKRLIHFSSIAAISQFPQEQPVTEKNKLISKGDIGTRYGHSKSEGEKLVLKSISEGMDVVIMAPTSVIGPYDTKPSVQGQSLIDMYNNSIPALVPGGYDWVDVRDICKATVAAIEQGKSGEKYILGSEYITIKDMSATIGNHFKRKVPSTVLPYWVARLGIPFEAIKSKLKGTRNGFTNEALDAIKFSNKKVDCSKAKADLGYHPIPVAQSIIDTLDWFKENNKL